VNSCAPASSTVTYAWSFVGGTPATATTLDPGTINYSSIGNYTVSLIATNECGPSAVASQSFSVNPTPAMTTSPLAQTICSGSSTSAIPLTATPSGTTFSWTATATAGITGYTISGTSATIPAQIISTTSNSPGTVTYLITPTVGPCAGTTVSYVITVNPAPTITTQPTSSTVCQGGTPTALTVGLNSTTVTPVYQWYVNTSSSNTGGTAISGATTATYNPPSTTTGTFYYYCLMTLASGGCSNLSSAVATVVISPLPTISTQPITSQNNCVGVSIASPLTVSYIGGTGTPTSQWYSNTTNATTGGTAVGGNTATYNPPVYTTAGTYYYYCVVSVSGTGCGSATSTLAQVTVYNDPTITAQPNVTQTLCQGATPTALQVSATGGNGTFTYQWYSNPNGTSPAGTAITGATSSTFIPPTTTVGTQYYYCIISQATLGCSVTSALSTVIINASPTIQNQPISSTLCLGGIPTALSLTYTNGVGTPTYQWFVNTSASNTGGTAIAGATNATYNPPATSLGTLYYYCQVTFAALVGSCSTVSTNAIAIIVEQGAVVNSQPLANQSVCVGASLIVPLSVGYSNGSGSVTYQWYYSTTASASGGSPVGTNSSSYTPPVFTSAGTYYYYAVLSFSGSGCGAITSALAQVDVINDPVVTSQPITPQTLCQTTAASPLNVTVTGGIGTTYSYQWYSNVANSTTGGILLTGETNSTFTPPSVIAGTLYYYCVITQANGSGCGVTSATAMVTVNLAPAIASQPSASTLCLGGVPTPLTVTYSNGAGTPNYQWYTNTSGLTTGGVLISGATSSTYNPSATLAGTNYYYCVITFPSLSGGCSVITSNAVAVLINPYPVIASTNTTICSGATFTIDPNLIVTNLIPSGTTYTWTTPTVSPIGAITGAIAQTIPQSTISQTLINLSTSPATVIYTVTPISGTCVGAPFTITVIVNPAINPNIVVNNNACFGVDNASITTAVTGGIPFSSGSPYLFTWTGPNGFTSSASSIFGIEPGIYSISISDLGGCPFSNSYTISEPTEIVITTDFENDVTCFGSANGSIGINITGGTGSYSYQWTYNTAPFSNIEDISNLAPGTYEVTVTDVNNCGPKIVSYTITQPPLLVVSLISQTNVLCFGAATGTITVGVLGGNPITSPTGVTDYLYSWTGPNGFTSNLQNLSNLFAGTYDLSVTDANGCIKTLTVIVTQSPEILIGYTTTPITCYGANNATMTVTLSGGSGPYQYLWSNLATTLNQTNLSAGNYTITVTDNLGCVKVATITIPGAPVFMVNPIVSNVSCFGAHDGSINLNLTGGIPLVSLVWSDGSTSGLIRNNLGPGTYLSLIHI
jgi:hypothetical protein